MSVYSVNSMPSNRSIRYGGTVSHSSSQIVSDLLRDLIQLVCSDIDSAGLRNAQIKAVRMISSCDPQDARSIDEVAVVNKISRYCNFKPAIFGILVDALFNLVATTAKSNSNNVSRAQTIAAQVLHLNVTKSPGALFAFLFALRSREALPGQTNILPASELLLSATQQLPKTSNESQMSQSLVFVGKGAGSSSNVPRSSSFMSSPATGRVLLSIVQGISVASAAAGIVLPHPADDLGDQQRQQATGQNRRMTRLAGVGWLCGRLRLICEQLRSQAPTTSVRSAGTTGNQTALPQLHHLIAASLATAAEMHLADYTRLLATIESRCSTKASNTAMSDSSLTSLTPLRLETQLFAASHQLRLLTGACEVVADILHRSPPNSSASILSYLFKLYTGSSDDELKQCAGSLLVAACRPLYRCIAAWLNDGRVPFGDFFIFCDPSVGLERFWADRFQFRKDALPSFISEALASKMLLIGKAIHYATTIAAAAAETGDGEFDSTTLASLATCSTSEYAAGVAAATGLVFPSADALLADVDSGKLATGRSSLFCYVDALYRQLARDLLAVVIGSGSRLAHNLQAIRAYLLMARGDFAVRLVELAAPILDQPAERVFVPGLRTSVLDAALRSTVVEPSPNNLLAKQADRVDCRLLQASPRDCGWDVFRLEWRIDPRLAPVLSPDSMISYARLSSLLVAMRHSHFALISAWVYCRRHERPAKRKNSTDATLSQIRRSVFIQLYATAHELRTFVDQLHFYVYLEVIEPAFTIFRRYCSAENTANIDLDGVIAAHKTLVDSLLVRCLLQQPPFGSGNETPSAELLDHLRNILQLCHTLAAISNEIAAMETEGATIQTYRSFSARIALCQRTAREHIRALLSALSIRRDPAQRCLAFRIDSSGFYSRKQSTSTSVPAIITTVIS